jgi:hypothetical protein
MANDPKKDCETLLVDSLFSANEAIELDKQHGIYDDIKKREQGFRQKLKQLAEDKIDHETKKLHDTYVARRNIKKATKNARTLRRALKNRLDEVVGRAGLDTKRNVYQNRLLNKVEQYSRMYGVPKGKGLESIKADSDLEKDLFKAIRKVDIRDLAPEINKLTKSQASKLAEGKSDIERLALSIASFNEYSRRFLNQHGQAIRYAKDYTVKFRYDLEKIKQGYSRGEFAQEIFRRLDIEKTYEGIDLNIPGKRKKIIEELEELYDTLGKEENRKINDFGDASIQSRANSVSRKFVWKSDEDAYHIFKTMSRDGLTKQIEQVTWGMANTALKISEFGYDHKKVAKQFQDTLIEMYPGQSGNRLDSYTKQRLVQAEADFTGDNTYAAGGLSTFTTAIKTMNNVKLLGNVLKQAMLDNLDVGRQSYYVQGKGFGALLDYQREFLATFGKHDKEFFKEVAQHVGIVLQYYTSESSMRVARGELSSSGLSKFANATDRAGNFMMSISTFLPWQTTKSKMASGVIGASIFTDMLDKVSVANGILNKSKLNKFEVDTFREYKISDREMAMLKEVEAIETWTGKKIISGKLIRDHILTSDPSVVSKKLGIKMEQVADAALDLADKYDMYVTDFFNRGTPTPQLAAKTALLKASNLEGWNVAMSLVTQFKDTPMMQLIAYNELLEKLKRINGVEGKDIFGAEGLAVIRAIGPEALAQTVPHMMAGMTAYLFYDLIWSFATGQDSFITKLSQADPEERNTMLLNIAGRTSVVPFAFEFANDATSIYGKGAAQFFTSSPTGDLIDTTFKALNPNNPTTLKRAAMKFMPNAWYVQLFKNPKSPIRAPFRD